MFPSNNYLTFYPFCVNSVMLKYMKAVIYDKPWNMSITNLPTPVPASGEALLRINTVGICGSDVHGFTGESGRRAAGMVMGHEVSGTVEQLGPNVNSPAIGTRVALYNIIADHAPTQEEGDPSFLNKQVIGVNLGKRGAMAEFLTVPARCLVPLSIDVPSEIGLLAEPLGVALHGWHRIQAHNIHPQKVAIIGAGTIGLATILIARHNKINHIASIDMIEAKTKHAKSFGAMPVLINSDSSLKDIQKKTETTLQGKPDLVIDAVGTTDSFNTSIELVSERGTILQIGNLAKKASLPLQDIVSNEITLIGTYAFDRPAFNTAVSLLGKFKDELQSFIQGYCTLSEVPDMMTSLAKGEKQPLKIVINIS